MLIGDHAYSDAGSVSRKTLNRHSLVRLASGRVAVASLSTDKRPDVESYTIADLTFVPVRYPAPFAAYSQLPAGRIRRDIERLDRDIDHPRSQRSDRRESDLIQIDGPVGMQAPVRPVIIDLHIDEFAVVGIFYPQPGTFRKIGRSREIAVLIGVPAGPPGGHDIGIRKHRDARKGKMDQGTDEFRLRKIPVGSGRQVPKFLS